MAEFTRECECQRCGRKYVVTGVAANPSNETQRGAEIPCECGAFFLAHVPGSANQNRIRIEPAGGPTGVKDVKA
jgi:hypothetical protein